MPLVLSHLSLFLSAFFSSFTVSVYSCVLAMSGIFQGKWRKPVLRQAHVSNHPNDYVTGGGGGGGT